MLVLGIDPGTATTGYGVVRSERGGLVEELIARHRPDALAVESIFYAKNVRTTVTLGHARGVILLAGELAGLTVHEFPPAEIKKAVVGTGAASKEQVQFMLTRLLRLKAVPTPSDAADGVAAALTFCMAPHLSVPAAPPGARRSLPATLGREVAW